MDRRDARMDLLENRLRWQKRAIIGLIVVFLFNTSPVLGTASKWFSGIFSTKADSSVSFLGKVSGQPGFSGVSDNVSELMSTRADLLHVEIQDEVLSKTAHAVGDTLRVSQIQIVNEEGIAVAIMGSNAYGGFVSIRNDNDKRIVGFGTTESGNGAFVIRNASEQLIAAVAADKTDKANGIIEVYGGSNSFSRIGINSAGNAFVSTANKSGVFVSGIFADDRGAGLLSVSNASGRRMGYVGAHASGEGNGVIGVLGEAGIFSELAISEDLGATLRVSNKNGQAVSTIGANEEGHGTLGAWNSSGELVSFMSADEDGQGLWIASNASGVPSAVIGAGYNGLGTLSIGDRVGVYVNEKGAGVVETLAKDGSVRWSSEMQSDGGGSSTSGLLGDLDGDGDVDFTDFLVFAQNFGKTSG